MTRQNRDNPGAGGRRGAATASRFTSLGAPKPAHARCGWQGHRLPSNWRERLPDPDRFYRARLDGLGARHANGSAQGRCPFHDDGTASLSVHLADPRGGWRRFAGCGPGDLVAFHMRLTRLEFAEAVRDRLRVER